MKTFLLLLLTLMVGTTVVAQGNETFSNIPASNSAYTTRTWTGDNGLQWTATEARTDQTITGKAIAFRNGSVSTPTVNNGIGSLSFKYKYIFTGNTGTLSVKVNGNVVGTLEIPNTATSVQTATFDNINIAGTFSLEIAETSPVAPNEGSFNPNARKAIDDIIWTSYSGAVCATPAAQPTNLTFGTISNNRINGSFTAANPAANEYLVISSTSNALTANPVNGTTYNADDVIGNGTVIARGAALSFSASDLAPGTAYYFYIFALNSNCSGGPLYQTNNPLLGNATTTVPPVCTAPANAPTGLTFTAGNNFINGMFNAAQGADGYLVVRSLTSSLDFTPANGTNYTPGQLVGSSNNGTVVSTNEATNFNATSLTANTTYYFYVFAVNVFNCSGGPLYNTNSLNGSATTTNNTTNEPEGYYTNATGKNCADLKTSLKTITTTGNTPRSYSSLWDIYKTADIKPREVGTGSASVIWDIYSDKPGATDPYNYTPGTHQCGNYSGEGDCYNREHSVPQSWFNGNTGTAGPTTDYHHIFPTDGKVNANRGSYIYGEVATATLTSLNGSKLGSSAIAGLNGPVFEPINEYKGDVARAFLYFVTRYQDLMPGLTGGANGTQAFDPSTYPSIDVPYLKLMIKWSTQDPVSQKERDRNNAAFAFQGNRNPYVDRPEYVDMVWNSSCPGLSALPVDLLYFKGILSSNLVQLSWQVANEVNFDRYEVERSSNGTHYNTIGKVKAQNLHNYTYNDDADAFRGSRVYYRLKKVDKDGKFTYSEVFTVHIATNTKFTVYPNPAANYLQVQINRTVNGKVLLQITNAVGHILQQQNVVVNGSNITLNTAGLSNGTYLVKMIYNGEQYIQKVLIAK